MDRYQPAPYRYTYPDPVLKDMENHLGFKYSEVVADAGYESEENYLFIEENGQTAYIKPQNYEISKTRKYKKTSVEGKTWSTMQTGTATSASTEGN